MRQLGALLEGLVPGATGAPWAATAVTGISDDSRSIRPGELFVAVPGTRTDATRFVPEALRRGAAAVVSPRPVETGGVPQIVVADVRQTLAVLAARWHGLEPRPDGTSGGLRLIGITGTNGKTTTAWFVQHIARAAGIRCARLGTIDNDLLSEQHPASLTTPGPLELARLLAVARDSGATMAVLEVSSHALDQQRVAGLAFAAAALTNLTREHLDYHGSMQRYADAKRRLFTSLSRRAIAVCLEDEPWAAHVLAGCAARRVVAGFSRRCAIRARLHAESIEGTRWTLHVHGVSREIRTPLIGRHNIANALVAAGIAHGLGLDPAAIAAGLRAVTRVPGRLERIDVAPAVHVFVDYAHSPDALRHALATLRPLTRGRLVVVYGCGGDRDRGKRPQMTRAVLEAADAAILTSDNPRTEDPQQIFADALAGLPARQRRRIVVETDRRSAIAAALAGARAGDVVLVAGKGHERYQIIGTRREPFDDVQEVRAAAARLGHRPTEAVR